MQLGLEQNSTKFLGKAVTSWAHNGHLARAASRNGRREDRRRFGGTSGCVDANMVGPLCSTDSNTTKDYDSKDTLDDGVEGSVIMEENFDEDEDSKRARQYGMRHRGCSNMDLGSLMKEEHLQASEDADHSNWASENSGRSLSAARSDGRQTSGDCSLHEEAETPTHCIEVQWKTAGSSCEAKGAFELSGANAPKYSKLSEDNMAAKAKPQSESKQSSCSSRSLQTPVKLDAVSSMSQEAFSNSEDLHSHVNSVIGRVGHQHIAHLLASGVDRDLLSRTPESRGLAAWLKEEEMRQFPN